MHRMDSIVQIIAYSIARRGSCTDLQASPHIMVQTLSSCCSPMY